MANPPGRLVVSVKTKSSDNLWWGPWPNGDKPAGGAVLAGAAMTVSAAVASILAAAAVGAPLILGLDDTNGPTVGGENNNGCYFTIFLQNPGTYADYQSGANTVTVGGVAVHDVRCLTPIPGSNPDNIWALTVQVGALSGLTINGTTAYPVVVTVGGQTPQNPLVSGFYQTINGRNTENIAYTPNTTDRILFIAETTGVDPTIGVAPTGANSAGNGGFLNPLKNLQTSTGSNFGGALTGQGSSTSTPTSSNTTPPGTKIYFMGQATYTNYLTGTLGATQNNRIACPWQITGAPNHSIQISRYPGAPGANSPAVARLIPPTSSAAGSNQGGIHGTDGARSITPNSFNSVGYGQYFSVSLLYVAPNTLGTSSDGSPINLQNNATGWRVWGNEVTWPVTPSIEYLTGGLQLVGDSIRASCNFIHDIFGGNNQENHGVYCGSGAGSVAVTNTDISFNEIVNITNPSGISVPFGGNGIQMHNASGHYTGNTVHHNLIDTTIKFGLNISNDGGGDVQVDYWCNVLYNVMQNPFSFAIQAGNSLQIRITNNTAIGCNYGNNFGYGGSNYTFVVNNGNGNGTATIVLSNNLFIQPSGAPTFGGWSSDNSPAAIKFNNDNWFQDLSGQHTTAPSGGGTYGVPGIATPSLANPLSLTVPNLKPLAGSPLLNAGTTPTNIGFAQYDEVLNPMIQGAETKVNIGALHS